MTLYEKNSSKRPEHLEKLYKALLTIPPTSIESERNFSLAGLFAIKIPSQLEDEVLSALLFLKNYYKKERKKC